MTFRRIEGFGFEKGCGTCHHGETRQTGYQEKGETIMTENKQILKALDGLTVLDETGAEIDIASLWRQRATALIFIRHFG